MSSGGGGVFILGLFPGREIYQTIWQGTKKGREREKEEGGARAKGTGKKASPSPDLELKTDDLFSDGRDLIEKKS